MPVCWTGSSFTHHFMGHEKENGLGIRSLGCKFQFCHLLLWEFEKVRLLSAAVLHLQNGVSNIFTLQSQQRVNDILFRRTQVQVAVRIFLDIQSLPCPYFQEKWARELTAMLPDLSRTKHTILSLNLSKEKTGGGGGANIAVVFLKSSELLITSHVLL